MFMDDPVTTSCAHEQSLEVQPIGESACREWLVQLLHEVAY